MAKMLLWLAGAVCVMCLSASGAQQQSALQPSTSPERALVNQYCVGCHNEKTKTAGLALDGKDVENVGSSAEVWEKVVRKLRARAMPPAGRPRPDESQYKAVITHLETRLDRVSAANPNPGRTDTFRRLNRTEYQNAIRDLLALEL